MAAAIAAFWSETRSRYSLLQGDKEARRYAIRAIGDCPHPPHASELLPFLTEGDAELRTEALRSLRKLEEMEIRKERDALDKERAELVGVDHSAQREGAFDLATSLAKRHAREVLAARLHALGEALPRRGRNSIEQEDLVSAPQPHLVLGAVGGHVGHAQTGAFRNDARGQWRFLRLAECMTPKTIDWDMFLGHQHEFCGRPVGERMRFDRASFAQWKCDAAFTAGPLTDLLTHNLTHTIAAMGVRRISVIDAAPTTAGIGPVRVERVSSEGETRFALAAASRGPAAAPKRDTALTILASAVLSTGGLPRTPSSTGECPSRPRTSAPSSTRGAFIGSPCANAATAATRGSTRASTARASPASATPPRPRRTRVRCAAGRAA